MTDFKPSSTPGDVVPQIDVLGLPLPRGESETAGHHQVLSLTERLFGNRPSLAVEHDPELGTQCLVVTVAAHGPVEQIVALNDRWHRELPAVAAERADQYRLAIDTR